MGQPESSASSTRRRPSTPTDPFSVGRPPRKAMRNSFSQRLSRLVRSAGSLAVRALRAALPGVAITVEGSKFLAGDANAGMLRVAVSLPISAIYRQVDFLRVRHRSGRSAKGTGMVKSMGGGPPRQWLVAAYQRHII